MIVAIEKKPAAAPRKASDEIFPAEFEGEIKPLKYRRVEEKKTGAYVTVPEITGVAFFFFIGGGMFGHSVHATQWGGEFGLGGMVIGIFVGVIGREKIRGVLRKCVSRFGKKSRNSKSVMMPGSTGLRHTPLV